MDKGVFLRMEKFRRPPPNRIVECMWGMRIAIFDQYLAFRLSLYIQCVPKKMRLA